MWNIFGRGVRLQADGLRAPAAYASLLVVIGGAAAVSAQEPAQDGVTPPMSREGSGTSWLPDNSPMYAIHAARSGWKLMGHGNVFLQYLRDEEPRGHEQLGSINWFMGMARRPLGAGRLGVKAMMSLDPATIAGCGYPDLLASGERCEGEPIVDQQHPHDLFMEIAATWEQPLSRNLALQIYGGPVGEPALGPVAFPHRASAMSNPVAPISHHWLDATHITYGVVTAAVHGRRWKAEGSVFNGREPDEERYDFDLAALDSYSGRFWFLPASGVALQVSAGRLTDAEPGHDDEDRVDVDRITASVTYHRLIGDGPGVWASTVAWGRNRESGESTDFLLVETTVDVGQRHAWFGRLDLGGKDAHDLDLHDVDGTFTVAKLQAGYTRYLDLGTVLQAGVGGTVTAAVVPEALRDAYGGRVPMGFGVFLTLRPRGMMMGADPHAAHQ